MSSNRADRAWTVTVDHAGLVRDEQLAERVAEALGRTGHPPLYDVNVWVQDGQLTLQGCVPSHYLKQVAETAALTVIDRNQINNDITVLRKVQLEEAG